MREVEPVPENGRFQHVDNKIDRVKPNYVIRPAELSAVEGRKQTSTKPACLCAVISDDNPNKNEINTT